MRNKIILLTAVLLTIFGASAVAEEGTIADPMKRDLIYVHGESETNIPVNGFTMTFGFDVERATFAEASKESARIIQDISVGIKELDVQNVEVIKGWDLVRQARVSLSSKTRKVSNRVVVKVLNFPEGRMHELIAKIIDSSLSADASVGLEDVKVFVSEDVEQKKKEELFTEALKALQSNAKRAAEALGRELSEPKRVFITNYKDAEQLMEPAQQTHDYAYEKSELRQASLVSFQKSFRVDSQITDHVKLQARVTGVYEIK